MNAVLKEGEYLDRSALTAQSIQNCMLCSRTCLELLNHCLDRGKCLEGTQIKTLMNCIEICDTTAQFMVTGSPFHQQTCSLCAEVCGSCAETCESCAGDDAKVKECADECRICADSCRKMC